MKMVRLCAVAGFFLLLLAPAAYAQATRTWVSGVGDDVNPCSRTAPCKTFAGAISKTAAGGEINVLDSGGFGAVTITKSISIVGVGAYASILASGTQGIVISAGPGDVVQIRDVTIDGAGPSPGLNGVRFNSGAALHLTNVVIRNFRGAAPNGHGVWFRPSTGASALFMTDVSVTRNGGAAAGTGTGIFIQPTGSAAAKAMLERVQASDNVAGVRIDALSTTGGVSAAVHNSVAAGNATVGFAALTAPGGSPVNVMIDSSIAYGNAVAGFSSNGAGSTMRLATSVATANGVGLRIQNSGALLSYQNNRIDGNATDVSPGTGTLPQR